MSSNKPGDLKVYVTENRGEMNELKKNSNKNSDGGSGEMAQQIKLYAPI